VQTCTADGTGLSSCTGCPAGQGGSGGATNQGGAGGTAAAGGESGGAAGSGSDLFHLMPPAADQACYECLITDCKSDVQACNDNPECATDAACVIDTCLGNTSTNALISCAFGCGVNPQSPAAQLALPIATCINNQCKDACASAIPMGGSGGMGQGGQGQGGTAQGGTAQGGNGQGGDPGAAADKVACGSNLCDTTKGEDCCISVQGFTPDFSCKTKGQCTGGIISIEQPCDGPEDCGGQQCCGALNGLQSKISCEASCGAKSTELCHKDDDCAAPATCQSCSVMGFTFRLCGTSCPGGGPPGG
jgi:hypothetical protein